jgi:hypothetical protein
MSGSASLPGDADPISDPDLTDPPPVDAPATIRQRVLGFLADHPGADHEEIAAGAGTRPNSTSRTLTELHRLGLVEPLPKAKKQDRSRWQLVPDERRDEVAAQAKRKQQQAGVPADDLTPAQKVWYVKRFIRDDTVNKMLLDEAADRTEAAKRARREARAWNQMVAQNKKDYAKAMAEGSPMSAFYGAKQLVISSLEGIRGLARNTFREIESREQGMGEIGDEGWWDVRRLLRQQWVFGKGIDKLITKEIIRDGGGDPEDPRIVDEEWQPEIRELNAGPSLTMADMADVELEEVVDAELIEDEE